MRITSYGCLLLRNFDPPTGEGPYSGCPRSSSAAVDIDATYSVSLSLEADGLLLPFTVKTGGVYELCAVPETETADPKISLLGPDQTALASNDDYRRGESAARIGLPLEGGVDYFLDIQDYFGDLDSTVKVVIKKQDTASTTAGKLCDGHLPERTSLEKPPDPPAGGEVPSTQQQSGTDGSAPPDALTPPAPDANGAPAPSPTPPPALTPPASGGASVQPPAPTSP